MHLVKQVSTAHVTPPLEIQIPLASGPNKELYSGVTISQTADEKIHLQFDLRKLRQSNPDLDITITLKNKKYHTPIFLFETKEQTIILKPDVTYELMIRFEFSQTSVLSTTTATYIFSPD